MIWMVDDLITFLKIKDKSAPKSPDPIPIKLLWKGLNFNVRQSIILKESDIIKARSIVIQRDDQYIYSISAFLTDADIKNYISGSEVEKWFKQKLTESQNKQV
ncbi:hypothetical protein BpHYR1_015243 [Brachionus plicatilis]|uniref:Uncharacterized protein n=1 Tax=Brachionus plicatilis TaxID=10195 RepID=A0A3M7Q556_BRAPC|nr:hypothetical protein BpHYR1_015243 [Brachionus plicatilis]